MATDINTVTITGRLTRDSELKDINGTALIKFSIAVNKYAGKDKEKEVFFFDVQMWGNYAKALNSNLLKGQQVTITGELQQQRWESDQGARSRVLINASNIVFKGESGNDNTRTSDNNGYPPPKTPEQRREEAKQQGSSPGPESFDDDIPF